jgi:DNA-binding MarR family transcriptional regulator
MSFEDKVSRLNDFFYYIYQKRVSTEKSVCKNSPLSSLNYNDLKVFETIVLNQQITMGCLADELQMAMSTLTGITDKLVHMGFLDRARSESDRRVVVVRLTESGNKAFAVRKTAHASISRDILCSLTEEEQDTLLRLLEKVISS